MRDTISHFKGVRRYQFEPNPLPDGSFEVHKPRLKGEDTLALMRVIYSNNVQFHQEFVCRTLACLVPPLLLLMGADSQSMIEQYGPQFGKYIKYSWAIRLAEQDTPAAGS